MRILFLTGNRLETGTYWRAFHLARVMTEFGHRASLAAISDTNRFFFRRRTVEGVEVVETPDLLWGALRSGWDPWNTAQRIFWLNGESFDLAHAFESRPAVLYPALFAQRRGARLVMDWCDWFGRGGSVEERPRSFSRFLLRPVETYFEEHFRGRAQGTTVINRFLGSKALTLGVPPESIFLLPNGCRNDTPILSPGEARKGLGLDADHFYIGLIGNLYSRDTHLMKEAFRCLLRRCNRCRLLLIGNSPPRVDLCAHGEEVAAAIFRTGRLSRETVAVYAAACDLFWCPLRDSGANRGRFPLKLNDYLTAGRPTVATAVGEIADFIQTENIGALSSENPADLAEVTWNLLQDKKMRLDMGRRARGIAETVLDWRHIGENLEAFYRRILS